MYIHLSFALRGQLRIFRRLERVLQLLRLRTFTHQQPRPMQRIYTHAR